MRGYGTIPVIICPAEKREKSSSTTKKSVARIESAYDVYLRLFNQLALLLLMSRTAEKITTSTAAVAGGNRNIKRKKPTRKQQKPTTTTIKVTGNDIIHRSSRLAILYNIIYISIYSYFFFNALSLLHRLASPFFSFVGWQQQCETTNSLPRAYIQQRPETKRKRAHSSIANKKPSPRPSCARSPRDGPLDTWHCFIKEIGPIRTTIYKALYSSSFSFSLSLIS